MKFGIVGAGLIGNKRAHALKAVGAELVAVADVDKNRAQAIVDGLGGSPTSQWTELVARRDIDAVVVATSNQVAPEIVVAALEAGKHVLVEKPAGRHPGDLTRIVDATKKSRAVCRVGFNHRFHPGFQKLKATMALPGVGDVMYFRARYGHGGRLGYEKEWRGNPEIGGGGELLDQGVHLIDLCRWLGGEFELEWGTTENFFWQWPVEDNGFLLMKSPDSKRRAFLHASCTEWKNLFDFEMFCRYAKLEVFGLGRSYGEEEFRYYQMKPEMGPPEIQISRFAGEDLSWLLETESFIKEINGIKTDIATAQDALRSVEIVHAAYASSNLPFAFKKDQ